MMRGRGIPALAALALAAACAGSGPTPRARPTPPAVTGAAASPTVAALPSGPPPSVHDLDGCVDQSGARIVATPEPGGWLPVAFLGHGRSVVILSEQSDQLACDWLPFARRLVRQGYQVALYDFVGAEQPPAILARVVGLAVKRGATCVGLLGSSEGGKASLVAAAATARDVDAVVALSAERSLAGIDVARSVRHLHVPMLLVSARHDPYGSAAADRRFMQVAPVADKRIVWVPGYRHGTDLLKGPHGQVVAAAVTRFLAQHLR